MSATTATDTPKRYTLVAVFYHPDSDELISVQSSLCPPLVLGVKPTRANQQTARMVLSSCEPKFVARFDEETARRARRLGPKAQQLPTFLVEWEQDFGKLIQARTVLDLVKAGLVDDPQA